MAIFDTQDEQFTYIKKYNNIMYLFKYFVMVHNVSNIKEF